MYLVIVNLFEQLQKQLSTKPSFHANPLPSFKTPPRIQRTASPAPRSRTPNVLKRDSSLKSTSTFPESKVTSENILLFQLLVFVCAKKF